LQKEENIVSSAASVILNTNKNKRREDEWVQHGFWTPVSKFSSSLGGSSQNFQNN